MCVHLAGSYQGLALPDDRYKEGAERGSRGKKRNTGQASSTHLNRHIDMVTQS